jgi:hypothetical protein
MILLFYWILDKKELWLQYFPEFDSEMSEKEEIVRLYQYISSFKIT